MEKHITPMTELKQRWASMRAAFADHVYEASEPDYGNKNGENQQKTLRPLSEKAPRQSGRERKNTGVEAKGQLVKFEAGTEKMGAGYSALSGHVRQDSKAGDLQSVPETDDQAEPSWTSRRLQQEAGSYLAVPDLPQQFTQNDLLQIGATPVPVQAEPEKSPYNPAGTRGEGEARESTTTVRVGFPTSETWDSRGGQTFTDEQAIALLSMGLNDLSGGVESRHAGVESTGELVASEKDHCQVPSGSSAPPAQIITSPNGIFAGTVIGVKASSTKDGITHISFGPDAKTAVNRLLKRLHQYD